MDIVTELYNAPYSLPSEPGLDWLEREVGTVPNNVCVRAGDEIKRLRSLLNAPDGRSWRTHLFEEAERRGRLEAEIEQMRRDGQGRSDP